MNTLKYSLEYRCYPIWNYNENDELVDNNLPDELRGDVELNSLLLEIQEAFDNLYIDTPTEFSTRGFQNEAERQRFLFLLCSSIEILRNRYGMKYHIVCKYNENSFPMDDTL